VSKALLWLKLNHVDYYDCEISEENLASYPEEGPPVVVDYYPSSSNKNPESTSVHDLKRGGWHNRRSLSIYSPWPYR